MPKPQFNIRLPQELQDWLEAYCLREGRTKTSVIEDLIRNLREGRVSIPKAFPAQQGEAGDSHLNPIFISWRADER